MRAEIFFMLLGVTVILLSVLLHFKDSKTSSVVGRVANSVSDSRESDLTEFKESKNDPETIHDGLVIDTCVVASTNDEKYLPFFPIVHHQWKRLCGIRCILVLISDTLPAYLEAYKDDIVLFPPIDNLSPVFTAQTVRLLYPGLVDGAMGVIISDMDMLPMRKSFFTKNAARFSTETFGSFGDIIEDHYKQIAICYNVATPQVWRRTFGCHSLQDVRNKLVEISVSVNTGWSADQEYLYKTVYQKPGCDIFNDKRKNGYNRLDRLDWDNLRKNLSRLKQEISLGVYADFHMPRPWSQYKRELRELMDF